ncbi:MAG: hypothetical protein JHC98_01165 [Thermoleophilaceae bacterium]|nr:hypothetical protein [Thermoleophilaceae bacterium]
MNQDDQKLDPRAVPIAVASAVVIVLGILLTYANTTFGAVIVLLGLCGVVWVAILAARGAPTDRSD